MYMKKNNKLINFLVDETLVKSLHEIAAIRYTTVTAMLREYVETEVKRHNRAIKKAKQNNRTNFLEN